jgi:hypothetical protein
MSMVILLICLICSMYSIYKKNLQINYWISVVIVLRCIVSSFNYDGYITDENLIIRVSIRIVDLNISLIVIDAYSFVLMNISSGYYCFLPSVFSVLGAATYI